jgi:hypothetical protein
MKEELKTYSMPQSLPLNLSINSPSTHLQSMFLHADYMYPNAQSLLFVSFLMLLEKVNWVHPLPRQLAMSLVLALGMVKTTVW